MSTIIWFNTKFRKIGMGTIVGMGLIPIACKKIHVNWRELAFDV